MKDGEFILSVSIFFSIDFRFFDQSISAKFDLNQTIFSIPQMNDGITFLFSFVSIVIDFATQCIRKNTKVSDAERFEKKSQTYSDH